ANIAHARRSGRRAADMPERLLVVSGFPHDAPGASERVAALAAAGPAARLHLIVAGWTDRPAAAHATHVAASRKAGESAASADVTVAVAGIPAAVTVDPPPPAELTSEVCAAVAASREWFAEGLS
ncbi:MAG: hypothetical protein ACRDXX_22110, partial [Stackebrandtia sp.]